MRYGILTGEWLLTADRFTHPTTHPSVYHRVIHSVCHSGNIRRQNIHYAPGFVDCLAHKLILMPTLFVIGHDGHEKENE